MIWWFLEFNSWVNSIENPFDLIRLSVFAEQAYLIINSILLTAQTNFPNSQTFNYVVLAWGSLSQGMFPDLFRISMYFVDLFVPADLVDAMLGAIMAMYFGALATRIILWIYVKFWGAI